MAGALEGTYGIGRLAFGAGLMVAPRELAGVLMGRKEARRPLARIALRGYGTRDVVLGVAILRALAGDRDLRPWLGAGIASDLLDVALQLAEWPEIPSGKREVGIATALGAAATGAALLARQPERSSRT